MQSMSIPSGVLTRVRRSLETFATKPKEIAVGTYGECDFGKDVDGNDIRCTPQKAFKNYRCKTTSGSIAALQVFQEYRHLPLDTPRFLALSTAAYGFKILRESLAIRVKDKITPMRFLGQTV
jgi:hypothetical protein